MRSALAEETARDLAPRHFYLAYADATRTTAILVVVLHHLVYMTKPAIGHNRPYELGYLGVWGVNCFFVLSGLLLGRPYIARLLDPYIPMPSIKLFYYRRFLRIYPLYALAICLSVLAVTATYGQPPTAGDVAAHLAMLHTFRIEDATALNGPLWTMSVDTEFYLVLPLAALLCGLLLRGRSAHFRTVAIVTCLLCTFLGSIIFRYFILSTVPATDVDFAVSVVLIRNLIGFAGTFALGLLLALLAIKYGDSYPRLPQLYIGMIAFGIVIAAVQLCLRMDQAPPGPVSLARILRLTFNEALASVSVAFIYLGMSAGNFKSLSRFTRTRFVTSLAAMSYAIYLIHWPVLDGISAALGRPTGLLALLKVGSVSALIILTLAYGLHRFIERPILELKDSKRDRPTVGYGS